MIKVTNTVDVQLHKMYKFVYALRPYLTGGNSKQKIDIRSMVDARDFEQKLIEKHTGSNIYSAPEVSLQGTNATAKSAVNQAHLSEILDAFNDQREKNGQSGQPCAKDTAVHHLSCIADNMLNSEIIRTTARNNSQKDFALTFDRLLEDELIRNIDMNEPVFSWLLNNAQLRQKAFTPVRMEIYNRWGANRVQQSVLQ